VTWARPAAVSCVACMHAWCGQASQPSCPGRCDWYKGLQGTRLHISWSKLQYLHVYMGPLPPWWSARCTPCAGAAAAAAVVTWAHPAAVSCVACMDACVEMSLTCCLEGCCLVLCMLCADVLLCARCHQGRDIACMCMLSHSNSKCVVCMLAAITDGPWHAVSRVTCCVCATLDICYM
jgi:hypothetical protein